MADPGVRFGAGADLTASELYALLRLRGDVFVVEQECPYPDIDGRDLDPDTEHAWLERDGQVVAAARILQEAEGTVVGRVVTAAQCRGDGLASTLLEAVLDRCGDRQVRIGAQAHLEGWYERFGFRRSGPDYLEDGIPHLPMLRPAPGHRSAADAG